MRLLGGSSTTREFTKVMGYPPERDALTQALGEVFGEHRASVHEAITNYKERVMRLETTSNFEERFTRLAHQAKRGKFVLTDGRAVAAHRIPT